MRTRRELTAPVMAKGVTFTAEERADLRAIPQPGALQILKTFARFLESGHGDVKKLMDVEPPKYRLRAQHYRVFFREVGGDIEVTRIRDRKEAYR